MQALRDEWESLLSEVTLIAAQMDVAPQFSMKHCRKRKRKRFHDETSQEKTDQDSAATVFRNTVFFTAMDNIISDLDTRFRTTEYIVEEFSAVLKVGQIAEDEVPSVCQPLIRKYSRDLTPEFQNEFSETYSPVMTVYLGWQRTVVLVGYDAVKEALVDQADDFSGRGPLPFLMKTTKGYGLGISNGECWRQLRRFTLTTLRDFGMGRKGMEQWIQEESQHLRNRLNTFKAKPFDPSFLLNTLKFGSIPWGQMYNVFPRIVELFPGSHHSAFARIEELREFVCMKIQEHNETMDPSSPRDFIDSFLIRANQEKDLPSTDSDLRDPGFEVFTKATDFTDFLTSRKA
ncbi:Cytochrome P450 2G1 [Dissostichus eleginoides]|uniref:Cytochrome P450 2G1 n=1 Tax=Dissostichus eleginoides TaxID=100907 RepID=A0AAD9CEJ2_DISEL|nr:Cytochrome P450 2G1 [Dissostichus eleginoides]